MSRSFKFEPTGLVAVNGSPTHKGPEDVVIAKGNSSQLVDNPNYTEALTISSPALTITPKL